MKTVITAALLSASLIAGVAQAGTSDNQTTRAQVVAELQQAQAQGLISNGEQGYPVQTPVASSKSRQEVLAELASAESTGQISRGELDYPPVANDGSTESRAEVVAQLVAYENSNPDQVIAH